MLQPLLLKCHVIICYVYHYALKVVFLGTQLKVSGIWLSGHLLHCVHVCFNLQWVLGVLNFPLLLLTSFQVFLNLLALLALHGVGLIHLKPFSLRLGERLFVPAVCGSVQCILATWAEACSHSGLFPLIARFLPMVSLSLGHLFALSMPGSIHVSSLLTVLTIASVTVTGTLFKFNLVCYLLVFATVRFQK